MPVVQSKECSPWSILHQVYKGAKNDPIFGFSQGWLLGDALVGAVKNPCYQTITRVLMQFLASIRGFVGPTLYKQIASMASDLKLAVTVASLKRLFKNLKPTPPGNLKPSPREESLTDTVEQTGTLVLKGLFVLFAFVGLSKESVGKWTHKIANTLKDVTTSMKGVDDLWKTFIAEFIPDTSLTELKLEAEELEKEIMDWRSQACISRIRSLDDARKLAYQCVDIQARLAKEKDKGCMTRGRALASLRGKLLDEISSISAAVADCAVLRPEPVSVHVFGPVGGGKSEWIETSLIKKLNLGAKLQTDEVPLTYELSAHGKFADAYYGQPIVLCHDIFNANLEKSMAVAAFPYLAAREAGSLEGAAVEVKNMKLKHQFFITSGNHGNFPMPRQNNHAVAGIGGAINSRLNRYYCHWPEYDTSKQRFEQADSKDIERKPRKLCFHKIPVDNAMDGPFDQETEHPRCPDHPMVSEDDIVNAMLERNRINMLRFRNEENDAYQLAAHKLSPAREEAGGPQVILFHGPSATGKTTFVEEILTDLERETVKIDKTAQTFRASKNKIYLLDDILPERQDLFRMVIDACDSTNVVVVIANLRKKKILCRYSFPELHSRVLTRLPFARAVYGHDSMATCLSIVRGAAYNWKDENNITMSLTGERIAKDDLAREFKESLKSTRVALEMARELPDEFHGVEIKLENISMKSFVKAEVSWNDGKETPSLGFHITYIKQILDAMKSDDYTRPILLMKLIKVFTGLYPGRNVKVKLLDHELVFWIQSGKLYWFNEGLSKHPESLIKEMLGLESRSGFYAHLLNRTAASLTFNKEEFAKTIKELNDEERAIKSKSFFSTKEGRYVMSAGALIGLILAGVMAYKFKSGKKEETSPIGQPLSDKELVKRATELVKKSDSAKSTFIGLLEKSKAKKFKIGMNPDEYEGHMGEEFYWYAKRAHENRDKAGHGMEIEVPIRFESKTELPEEVNDLLDALVDGDYRSVIQKTSDNISQNHLTIITDDGSCEGWMLFERIGFTVGHVFATGRDGYVHTAKGRFPVRLLRKYSQQTDLALFEITDKSVESFKDIRKYFLPAEHLELMSTGCLSIGKEFHHGSLELEIMGRAFTTPSLCRNVLVLRIPGLRQVTSRGSCGGLYFAHVPQAQNAVIVGIHTASMVDGRTYLAALLTREIIDKICTDNSPRQEVSPITTEDSPIAGKQIFTDSLGAIEKKEFEVEKNDRLQYVGYSKKAFIPSTSVSSFVCLRHPVNEQHVKVPSLSRIPKDAYEQQAKDPFGRRDRGMTQLLKNVLTEPQFDPEIEKVFDEGYFSYLETYLGTDDIKVATDFEILNGGRKGTILEGMNGLDMTTSLGFTCKKLFNLSKKGELFEQNEGGLYHWKNTSQVEQVRSYIKFMDENPDIELVFPIVTAVKDEMLPRKKVMESGKIRVYENVDFFELYRTKKYLGWMLAAQQRALFSSEHTAGYNPVKQAALLYRALGKRAAVFTLDYSAWDKKLPRQVQRKHHKAILLLCSMVYTEQEMRHVKNVLDSMEVRLEVYKGNLWIITGGVASGILLTNFGNSAYNFIVVCTSIMHLIRKALGRIPTVQEVVERVDIFTHGDDVILGIDEEWVGIITFQTLADAIMGMWGMPVTPGRKDGDTTLYEQVDDASFLKRTFVNVEGKLTARLDQDSIAQQVESTTRLDKEHLVSVFSSALVEASLWGKDYHDKIRECARKNLKDLGFRVQLPVFNDSLRAFLQTHGDLKAGLIGIRNPDDVLGDVVVRQESDTTNKLSKMKFPGIVKRGDKTFTLETYLTGALVSILKTQLMLTVEEYDWFVDNWDLSLVAEKLCYTGLLEKIREFREEAVGRFPAQLPAPANMLIGSLTRKTKPFMALFMLGIDEIYVQGENLIDRLCCQRDDTSAENIRAEHRDVMRPYHVLLAWNRYKTFTEGDASEFEMLFNELHQPQDSWLLDSAMRGPYVVSPQSTGYFCPKRTECGMISGIADLGKLANHWQNSHEKRCWLCGHEDHAPTCPALIVFKCTECSYLNKNAYKVANHTRSAHKKRTMPKFLWPRSESRQLEQGLPGGTMLDSEAPAMGTTGQQGIRPIHGVPDIASAMYGFTEEARDAIYKFFQVGTFDITDTSGVDQSIFSCKYSDTQWAQVQKNYLTLHRFIHGTQEIKLQFYGATNYTGAVAMGWHPEGSTPTTFNELQAYGNCTIYPLSYTAPMTLPLAPSASTFEAVPYGSNKGYGSLTILVKAKLRNTIGDGTATLSGEIYRKFLPDGGVSAYKPELVVPQTLHSVNDNNPFSNEETLVDLFLDGDYERENSEAGHQLELAETFKTVFADNEGVTYSYDYCGSYDTGSTNDKSIGAGFAGESITRTEALADGINAAGLRASSGKLLQDRSPMGDLDWFLTSTYPEPSPPLNLSYSASIAKGKRAWHGFYNTSPSGATMSADKWQQAHDGCNFTIDAFRVNRATAFKRNLNGLKCLTARHSSGDIYSINSNILTKYPANPNDATGRYFLESIKNATGFTDNVQFNLIVGVYSIPVLLKDNNLWVNANSDYGVLSDVPLSSIRLTGIRKSFSENSIPPQVGIAVFTSLSVRQESTAAIIGAAMGSQAMDSGTSMWTSRKNRQHQLEMQANMMDFAGEQAGLSRRHDAKMMIGQLVGASRLQHQRLEQERTNQTATNANMATQANSMNGPGRGYTDPQTQSQRNKQPREGTPRTATTPGGVEVTNEYVPPRSVPRPQKKDLMQQTGWGTKETVSITPRDSPATTVAREGSSDGGFIEDEASSNDRVIQATPRDINSTETPARGELEGEDVFFDAEESASRTTSTQV